MRTTRTLRELNKKISLGMFSKTAEKKISSHALELITSLLLALGGVATSWSGYQAALWSGIQAANYSQATAARLESTRASNEAGQRAMVDIDLFIEWLNAYAAHDEARQNFYHTRFRPEFVPAFEAWLASKPKQNPKALSTPFAQPEYRLALAEEARHLSAKADTFFKAGQTANRHSDNYVLNTVILAMVMFLCSIAQQFKRTAPRIILLTITSLMTLMGVGNFLRYPLALE